ncbi:acetyl-CoA synthetase-like protein [Auriscalpium vulgare]|uniref:Acetyl-CoA synthetase-like protein n=1 Tax=Auriscalpium vulgare TaxID=40419 RepID=A0ACB8R896_9AGAM|nr:acetyl-CoA synthetase-like protein [Auriscalpium vulgare]
MYDLRLHARDVNPNLQPEYAATFSPPPLDGSVSVPEAFEYHGRHSAEHTLFVYADGAETHTVSYAAAWRMIRRAARIVRGHYMRLEDRYLEQARLAPATHGPTIGILASVDSISYFSALVGTMRLGLVPFPISVRNSAAAVAHLIKSAHVLQLLVSPDPAMKRLAAEAAEMLSEDGLQIEVLSMVLFDDIKDGGAGSATDGEDLEFKKLGIDDVLILMHSSGSTAFPKVVPFTNRAALQWSSGPLYGQVNCCGTVLGMHTAPLFHVMGLDNIFRAVSVGVVLAVFKPSSPPVLPTPENYLEAALATQSSMLYCVPSFVEAWFKEPANILRMTAFKAILYGGAPMNKAVGEQLVMMGITLSPFYGSTETGCVSMFLPADMLTVDRWEYFKLAPRLTLKLLPQDGLDGIFEAAIVETDVCRPNVLNWTTDAERRAYRTNDLLQRHPTDPALWKIYGRADEQIMLSNGEKAQAILARDPHIAAAVMFGRGRFQNGVLVEPKREFAFDPSDERLLAAFRERIWPTVEKMNAFAPAHSRLFKEMIIVSSPSKPFEYTVKGTPRRPVVIKNYEEEINAHYEALKDMSQTDLVPPSSWDKRTTLQFVRLVAARVLRATVGDDVDLFQNGCDSLQAISIGNALLHALRSTTTQHFVGVPTNFVYANPTITALCHFVTRLLSPERASTSEAADVPARARAMRAMADKYSTGWRVRSTASSSQWVDTTPAGEAVLLTGTTGRLGCHLLAQLLTRPSVRRVYALNRAAQIPLRERQRAEFRRWGLNDALLDLPAVMFLEGDLEKEELGLDSYVFDQVQATVTSIIHNAWRVDFNLTLPSFELLVAGVRNLVDFALDSPHSEPPRILFTSSIGVFMNDTSCISIPEVPIADPEISVGTGYGESKWAAETVLLRAMRDTGVRVSVVRVGQLSGDGIVGGWNETEWVAAMLRGSQLMGCVPVRDEMVSWVPVDVAASALLDMLDSPHPVLHLVHPQPVPWTVVSGAASAILGAPVVPYVEWAAKLHDAYHASAADAGALKNNPVFKLVDFFAGMRAPSVLSTDRAVDASRNLRDAAVLGKEDVERWVGYWRNTGLLAA